MQADSSPCLCLTCIQTLRVRETLEMHVLGASSVSQGQAVADERPPPYPQSLLRPPLVGTDNPLNGVA